MFFVTNLLHGDLKKIVLVTYKNKAQAEKKLEELPTIIPQYAKLYELSKEHGFEIHVRAVGSFCIVALEPFDNKTVMNQCFDIAKQAFKKSYISNTISAKEIFAKSTPEVIKEKVTHKQKTPVTSTIKNKKELEKKVIIIPEQKLSVVPIVKKEKEKENLIEEKTVVNKSDKEVKQSEFNLIWEMILEHFRWKYLIITILLLILIRYFIKFKRIYDEY
jgi:predicted RND superfamily exporter protein